MSSRELEHPLSLRAHPSHDRTFFTGMSVVAMAAVFVGFAPTYYLKEVYGTPRLIPLVHLHGLLFTAWLVLLIAQTSLVAAGRTDLHRRIGVGGAVLAGLMTVLAFFVAVNGVRRGALDLGFFAFPLGTVVVFPVLVGAAMLYRRRTDIHKRLILIATAELVQAGVGRWPVVNGWGLWGFVVVTGIVMVLPLVVYDLASRRRLHLATVLGGTFFIGSQVLRVMMVGNETWLAVARWLTA